MPTDSFLNWFAGLVDGEGSFQLHFKTDPRNSSLGYYRTVFKLGLRSDDGYVIIMLRRELGIGHISVRNTDRVQGPYISKPQIWLEVDNKADCATLVEYLEDRLYTKKSIELSLWTEAIEILKNGGKGYSLCQEDQDALAILKELLHKKKEFNQEMSNMNFNLIKNKAI